MLLAKGKNFSVGGVTKDSPSLDYEKRGGAVAFTLDTYSHVVPGLQEAAAESFDKMLEPDVSKMS